MDTTLGYSELLKKGPAAKKRLETRAKAKAIPASLDDMVLALQMTKGNVGNAAKLLNISREVFARKIELTPSLRKVQADQRALRLDRAEEKLDEAVDEGNVTAITFMLRTLGKDRGYTEKTTVEHELGANNNSAALILAMQRGASTVEEETIEGESPKMLEDSEWHESPSDPTS